jgi:hypothetical protein
MRYGHDDVSMKVGDRNRIGKFGQGEQTGKTVLPMSDMQAASEE